VFRPDDNPSIAQGTLIGQHQLALSWHEKGHHGYPFWEVQDRFGLPTQQMPIQVVLVLIVREVAQVRHFAGLGMNDRVKLQVVARHVVTVNGQV
jgi:hypothetical protein